MIVLCGRNIKVATGQKSQTINICTEENIHGKYEYKIRLVPPFIDQNELLKLPIDTIKDLVDYLTKNHNGIIELCPTDSKGFQIHKVRPNSITKPKNHYDPSDDHSTQIQKIKNWNGVEVDIALSRGGVKAVSNPYDNLISKGIQPWPPPEILQKLYKSNQGRAYLGFNSNQSTSFLGYYSDLQSLHSEDAITWSVFGPLIYSDLRTQKAWCLNLMKKLGIAVSNIENVMIWLWRRIPHPDTLVSGGPEIDFGIITENIIIFGEGKWRSSVGRAQGKNKNKDQITLRREFFEKYGNVIFPNTKAFVVLGVSLHGGIVEESSNEIEESIFYNKDITWEELCKIHSHPLSEELLEYLKWKKQNSKL